MCVESKQKSLICVENLHQLDLCRKLAPTHLPLKYKTETDNDLGTPIFPRYTQVTCFNFGFSLARCVIFLSADWPSSALWSWFWNALYTMAWGRVDVGINFQCSFTFCCFNFQLQFWRRIQLYTVYSWCVLPLMDICTNDVGQAGDSVCLARVCRDCSQAWDKALPVRP